MRQFYATSSLAAGLGPEQEDIVAEEPFRVREILNQVRPATLAAVTAQDNLLNGFCTLDGLGSANTLSTNCISGAGDDPSDSFNDNREGLFPEPPEEAPETDIPAPEPPANIPDTPGPADIPDTPGTPDTPILE